MQRLISSLVIVSLSFLPTTSFAQHQFGGDTVVHDGRVLTNNLPPNTDTCNWVRGQGLSCQYERWDSNTRTHYVRSIPNVQRFFVPTTSFAQHQFGGDTVVHDGRVLTNNLLPNTDTCNWVRGQGLSCQSIFYASLCRSCTFKKGGKSL